MAEMRTAFEKTDYRLTRRKPMEPSETHPIGRPQPLLNCRPGKGVGIQCSRAEYREWRGLWRREPRCDRVPGRAQPRAWRRWRSAEPSVIVLGKTAAELSIQEEWLKLSRIKSHAVPLSYPSRTAGLQKRSRVTVESQSALALRAM
jgi:hypothetical protein